MTACRSALGEGQSSIHEPEIRKAATCSEIDGYIWTRIRVAAIVHKFAGLCQYLFCIEQFLFLKNDSTLHDEVDVFDGRDLRQWISCDCDHIC